MNLENHLKRSFFFHCKHPKSFREARGPGKLFFSFSEGESGWPGDVSESRGRGVVVYARACVLRAPRLNSQTRACTLQNLPLHDAAEILEPQTLAIPTPLPLREQRVLARPARNEHLRRHPNRCALGLCASVLCLPLVAWQHSARACCGNHVCHPARRRWDERVVLSLRRIKLVCHEIV